MKHFIEKFTDKLRGAWRSKTVWFNAFALTALAFSDQIMQALPQVQGVLGEDHYRTLLSIITVSNVVLRFITTHPLEVK